MSRHRLTWALRLAAAFLLLVPAMDAEDSAGIAANPLPAAAVEAIPVTLAPLAKQELMASGHYTSFSKGAPQVDLCPDPVAGANITRTLSSGHPNIGIQTLVVAAMPAGLLTRAGRTLVLYNRLHQFRTMAGIQYFSSTHGKVRTLFTTSHVVQAPGDRHPLSDPQYSAIEPSHDLFLEQDDSTFGKNLYALTVKGHEGGSLQLTMSNVERVWWGILPVLGPGALNLTMVIQASADGKYLYFYGNVGIRATRVLGMEEQVRTSFYYRVLALYHWFAQQAATA